MRSPLGVPPVARGGVMCVGMQPVSLRCQRAARVHSRPRRTAAAAAAAAATAAARGQAYDVVHLGNLCVDVCLPPVEVRACVRVASSAPREGATPREGRRPAGRARARARAPPPAPPRPARPQPSAATATTTAVSRGHPPHAARGADWGGRLARCKGVHVHVSASVQHVRARARARTPPQLAAASQRGAWKRTYVRTYARTHLRHCKRADASLPSSSLPARTCSWRLATQPSLAALHPQTPLRHAPCP